MSPSGETSIQTTPKSVVKVYPISYEVVADGGSGGIEAIAFYSSFRVFLGLARLEVFGLVAWFAGVGCRIP